MYKLNLTLGQYADLGWFVCKGYLPGSILSHEIDWQNADDGRHVIGHIPEYIAWDILLTCSKYPYEIFRCMSSDMRSRFEDLLCEIV